MFGFHPESRSARHQSLNSNLLFSSLAPSPPPQSHILKSIMSSWRRSGQGRQAKFNDAFSVDQDQASSSSSALPNNNNNNDYDPDQMAAYSITQLAQQASEESLNLLQHHQQEGQGDNSQQSEQEQQEALPHSNSHTEQPTADQVQFWNQHHHDEHEREVEQQTQLQNDDQPPPAKKAKKALDRKAQNREAQRTFRQKRDV